MIEGLVRPDLRRKVTRQRAGVPIQHTTRQVIDVVVHNLHHQAITEIQVVASERTLQTDTIEGTETSVAAAAQTSTTTPRAHHGAIENIDPSTILTTV